MTDYTHNSKKKNELIQGSVNKMVRSEVEQFFKDLDELESKLEKAKTNEEAQKIWMEMQALRNKHPALAESSPIPQTLLKRFRYFIYLELK